MTTSILNDDLDNASARQLHFWLLSTIRQTGLAAAWVPPIVEESRPAYIVKPGAPFFPLSLTQSQT